jgi:hypothetical protein
VRNHSPSNHSGGEAPSTSASVHPDAGKLGRILLLSFEETRSIYRRIFYNFRYASRLVGIAIFSTQNIDSFRCQSAALLKRLVFRCQFILMPEGEVQYSRKISLVFPVIHTR